MLKEITIPDDYNGSISQENHIVSQINNALAEIERQIQDIPDEKMVFEKHITDFENYTISVYFSENKKSANITIDDEKIVIQIGDKIVKVDSDGNIV